MADLGPRLRFADWTEGSTDGLDRLRRRLGATPVDHPASRAEPAEGRCRRLGGLHRHARAEAALGRSAAAVGKGAATRRALRRGNELVSRIAVLLPSRPAQGASLARLGDGGPIQPEAARPRARGCRRTPVAARSGAARLLSLRAA